MFLEDLGARIRDARSALGITQAGLAATLHVSPQAVSKWERGENAPDITLIPVLANLLGVTTDRLLGSQIRNDQVFTATVGFADIPGFTNRAEKLSPADVWTIINAHFYQITEVVLRFDGVPVKYIGDAFLFYFAGPEHSIRALRAAVLASRVIAERIRIGLNTGQVYMGKLGHPEHARMDIVGDSVNLAARAEGHAGSFTSGLAATELTMEGNFEAIRTGESVMAEIKGRTSGPVRIYEVVGESAAGRRPEADG